MTKKKPIIITGAHRSGTTWVGQMISAAPNIRYIHEPFNIDEPRIHPLKYWFEYIDENDPAERQQKIYKFIDEILGFNFNGIVKDFKMIRGPRDLHRFGIDTFERSIKRPLIKDPLAVMSVDWIAENFSTDVIALIRHPAAFVASLKVKSWTHVFDHFLEQPKLMKVLEPYAKQINDYSKNPPDIIDQGILLWNIIYYRIGQYKEQYPQWLFVRHEDLSLDPLKEYQNIYQQLDLDFTNKVEKTIIAHSSAKNAGHLTRDSKKNITTWKNRLSIEEIDRIRIATTKVSDIFYSEKDW